MCTIQAAAQDWIKGAYYSLAGDRFVVTDAALLQDSLVQGLSAIANKQDATFAAMTLDRLRGDGCDVGVWCWNTPDPNPHGPAAAVLLMAYDKFATDRMRWQNRAVTINGGKAANDEAIHEWRDAA